MRNWDAGIKMTIALEPKCGLTSNLHSTFLRVSAMLGCTGIGINITVGIGINITVT